MRPLLLFCFSELAGRFLRNEPLAGVQTPVYGMAIDAIDANLANERWLLLVNPGEVWRFDLEIIHKDALDQLTDPEIQERLLINENEGDAWTPLEVPTARGDLVLA